jgi:hypothetical protein
VAVCVSAHQLAGDLGAESGGSHHTQIVLDRSEIESREMIQLEPRRIAQHCLEVRSVKPAIRPKSDEVLLTAPIADLDETEPVARSDETHRLRVHGNCAGAQRTLGKIFLVEMDSHKL